MRARELTRRPTRGSLSMSGGAKGANRRAHDRKAAPHDRKAARKESSTMQGTTLHVYMDLNLPATRFPDGRHATWGTSDETKLTQIQIGGTQANDSKPGGATSRIPHGIHDQSPPGHLNQSHLLQPRSNQGWRAPCQEHDHAHEIGVTSSITEARANNTRLSAPHRCHSEGVSPLAHTHTDISLILGNNARHTKALRRYRAKGCHDVPSGRSMVRAQRPYTRDAQSLARAKD